MAAPFLTDTTSSAHVAAAKAAAAAPKAKPVAAVVAPPSGIIPNSGGPPDASRTAGVPLSSITDQSGGVPAAGGGGTTPGSDYPALPDFGSGPSYPAAPTFDTLAPYNPNLTPADLTQIQAEVDAQINPQIAGLTTAQAAYDAQQKGLRQDITSFTTAAGQLMAPIAGNISAAYNTAAANTAAFGKGFSDGLQAIMNGTQSTADKALALGGQGQAKGVVDAATNPGAGATNAFYAVHGYNPAVALSAIGAARSAQGAAQTGVLLARSQNLMFAAIKAAELGDKGWQDKIAAVWATVPSLRNSITHALQQYHLQLRQQQASELNSANALKEQSYQDAVSQTNSTYNATHLTPAEQVSAQQNQYNATHITPAEQATLDANAKQSGISNNLAEQGLAIQRAALAASIAKGASTATIAAQRLKLAQAQFKARYQLDTAALALRARSANLADAKFAVAKLAAGGFQADGITPLAGWHFDNTGTPVKNVAPTKPKDPAAVTAANNKAVAGYYKNLGTKAASLVTTDPTDGSKTPTLDAGVAMRTLYDEYAPLLLPLGQSKAQIVSQIRSYLRQAGYLRATTVPFKP